MVYSRVNKKGEMQFYSGNKKATPDEIKGYIKLNYEILSPEKLTADQRRYLGAVKGGKNRVGNSLYDKKGRFISQKLQDKALERALTIGGINIDALRKGKDVKTIREIFKNNEALKRAFDKLISETGLPFFYDNNKIIDKIEQYTGNIYLNDGTLTPNPNYEKGVKGSGAIIKLEDVDIENIIFEEGRNNGALMLDFYPADNSNAVKKVSSFMKGLKRKYDFFALAICLFYIGMDILYIVIDNEVLNTGKDSSIETSERDSVNQLYYSNKYVKKNKK